MQVFSDTAASGALAGGLTIGFASVDFCGPPKLPAPTTNVLNWLKATGWLFSSTVSTMMHKKQASKQTISVATTE